VREVPPVRYLRRSDGAIAYQVWGDGDLDLLVMTEFTTSVDNIWEHPGRLRLLSSYGELGRVVRFDPRGQGASDPHPLEEVGQLGPWLDDALHVLDELDVAGAVVCAEGYAVLGLGALVFALIQGPGLGWSSISVVGAFALAVGALAAFALVELRSRHPMLALAMFRDREFSSTNAITFLLYASVGGALFLIPVQLQIGAGYSPLEAGAALLPLTLIELIFSARSGRLATRIGPRAQLIAGPFIFAVSLLLLIRITGHQGYVASVLPAVIVMGIGVATFVAPLTATVMASATPQRAGLASAINNDVARIGSLLAVSVLPAIAGITGTTYLHPAQLSAGFRTAMIVAAVGCGIGGSVAALTVTNPASQAEPTTS